MQTIKTELKFEVKEEPAALKASLKKGRKQEERESASTKVEEVAPIAIKTSKKVKTKKEEGKLS